MEEIKFENNVILKAVRPMPDREDKVKQVLFVCALPDRGVGYTTPQLVAAWKRELIAAKPQLENCWVGANVFLSGALTAGMEATFADKMRNYRNIFRQIGATNEYVLAAGIDPDPDIQQARTVVFEAGLGDTYVRAL